MRLLPLALFLLACRDEIDDAKETGDTEGGVDDTDTDTDSGDTGVVDAADIDVSPLELDLGLLAVGEVSTGTVTVQNVGTLPLTASITITTGSPPFRVNSTGAYLVPGDSTELSVTFSPSDVGEYTGALTISSDDPDEPSVVVALAGTAELDSDGDGYVDSEDCDPDDPAINGGADEVWYDGIDQDCDGLSDYDQDADGHDDATYGGDDCNDTDASVNPSAAETWYDGVDGDCDSRSDYDQDGDGYDAASYGGSDCNDTDATVSPGVFETEGNGVDDDCDGEVDEARSTEDRDGDGYSEVTGDCNDADAAVSPAAGETYYDGVDSNCDGLSDYDQDGDGHDDATYGGDDCDDADVTVSPSAPETWYDGFDQDCDGASDYDQDGDGSESSDYGGQDCDDTDASINNGATEIWYDGIDQDCDGGSDFDQDGDGEDDSAYGGTDCDDTSAAVNTGATETCDGIDEDCDGSIDEGAMTPYYSDTDGDGYGGETAAGEACSAPAGYLATGDDCNDADAAISPAASESCDSVDNDCDGYTDEGVATRYYRDADSDGYGKSATHRDACSAPTGYVANSTDCDDTTASVSPAATEACNGVDDDCDGTVDEGLAGSTSYYADSDGDGYGDVSSTTVSCTAPSGYVTDATDCDDSDASVNPGEAEVGYDAADNDCSGIQDDMAAEDWSDWYVTGGNSSDYVGSGALLVSDDLNSDGDDELIIGSPYYDYDYYWYTYSSVGLVGFHDQDNADTPADAEDGYLDVYGGSTDMAGAALALGNADGGSYSEVAVGAPYDAGDGTYAGSVYVFDIYGESGTDSTSSIDEGTIIGVSDNGYLGSALAFGDMDGDGGADLAMGAPSASSARGRVYVALNGDGYDSGSMDADEASYYVRGVSNSDYLGTGVVFGDFDDDGYDDIVSCSPGDDDGGTDAGTCWIDGGESSPSESDTTVSSAYDTMVTGPAASAYLGGTHGALAVGDFDDDGVDDLALGAYGYGAVSIWAGGSLSGSETFATADWVASAESSGSYLGYALVLGDASADGVDDLLVGAPTGGSSGEGILYLLQGGQASGAYTLPSDQYASWSGPSASSYFGARVAGLTDLDGDGTEDFAVSAPYADESATNGGQVFVLPGY